MAEPEVKRRNATLTARRPVDVLAEVSVGAQVPHQALKERLTGWAIRSGDHWWLFANE
jgi:hypothetical protein